MYHIIWRWLTRRQGQFTSPTGTVLALAHRSGICRILFRKRYGTCNILAKNKLEDECGWYDTTSDICLRSLATSYKEKKTKWEADEAYHLQCTGGSGKFQDECVAYYGLRLIKNEKGTRWVYLLLGTRISTMMLPHNDRFSSIKNLPMIIRRSKDDPTMTEGRSNSKPLLWSLLPCYLLMTPQWLIIQKRKRLCLLANIRMCPTVCP